MSESDNTDEPDKSTWLRRLFPQDSFLGILLSFLGFGGGQENSGAGNVDLEPSVSYNDIRNANTTYELPATPLEKSRKALADLEAGTYHYGSGFVTNKGAVASLSHNLEDGPDIVREWLARSEQDASALDPSGKKSAAEMEAEINDAPRLGHIARARKYFAALVSHGSYIQGLGHGLGILSDDPRDIAQLMTEELDKADQLALASCQKPIDLTALDPTGTKSSAQMQEEVHKRIVEGYVVNARKTLYLLKHSDGDFRDDSDTKVQAWLDKANDAAKEYALRPIDASALDPSKSASEAQRELLSAVERDHIDKASLILYWSQHGGFGNPQDGIDSLNKELLAANKMAQALGEKPVDISMLDARGGKYRAADDRNTKELAAHNFQPGIERMSQAIAAAEKAALQNEPALAALIRPLDTPESQSAPPGRQK